MDKGAAATKHSHNERHQPEPPNNILLIRLAVKLDIGHVMKRDQVENHRNNAGDRKPTLHTGASTERQHAGHNKAGQQRPLVMQPQDEVVQALQQTAVDGVISSELECTVLLSQNMPALQSQNSAREGARLRSD